MSIGEHARALSQSLTTRSLRRSKQTSGIVRARKRQVRHPEAVAGDCEERLSRACAIGRQEDAAKGLLDPNQQRL